MSAIHPNILYVGDQRHAAALQHASSVDEWHVYIPTSTSQALAFYLFYQPDIVIIDAAQPGHLSLTSIGEIYDHLLSVEAEPIVLLTDDFLDWDIPVDLLVYSLPDAANLNDLRETVSALIEEKTGQCPILSLLEESI